MDRLAGKRAIVTGAARGIGLAICEAFVEQGARVLMADQDDVAVESAAASLGQPWTHTDVAVRAQIVAMADRAEQLFPQVDILVNNAGMTFAADFFELREEDFDRVMAVNLKSALHASQIVGRGMAARRSGAIINMSSVNAILAIPNQIPYAVSKGALRQLTNVTAQALAPFGVRVNAIGPGTILTELARTVMTDWAAEERILSRTPLGRLGEPAEVAAVAVFLASDEASYITGQTLYPDGGRLGLNYTVPVPPRPDLGPDLG
jgi:NAD(P)-dependent dehydrogenase (short-subunit alcohol dehydrogenase family)